MGAGVTGPSKKLLVLDLDETLMYASMFRLPMPPQFRLGLAEAVRRPGLGPFLDRCFALFDVGVWTSATEEYAAEALGRILPADAHLAFVWCRKKCCRATDPVQGDQYWVKDATLLVERGHALESILVLDDQPRSWGPHADRVIPIARFLGDPADTALTDLLPVLADAASAPDIPAFLRRFISRSRLVRWDGPPA